MKRFNLFQKNVTGRMRLLPVFFCMALVFASAVSVPAQQPNEQEGYATWYETDSLSLFASSPDLPVGTRLRVTNLNNNQQVIVMVNDSIPYSEGWLLDISKEAARNLDMLDGSTPVHIEILSGKRTAASEPLPEPESPEPGPETVPLPKLAEADTEPVPPPVLTMEPVPLSPPPRASPPSETPAPQPGKAKQPEAKTTIKLVVTVNGKEQTLEFPLQETSEQSNSTPSAPVPESAPGVPAPAPQNTAPARIVPAMPDSRSAGLYRLQAGAFASLALAQNAYNRLKNAGLSPALERNGEYYRVVIPGIKAPDIPEIARRLGAAGFAEAWVRAER